MTTQISSAELQLLVYRYLKESGFDHSAYVFAAESAVARSEAATADVPPGALVSFVHKGLLFSRLEKDVEAKRARLMKEPSVEAEGENGTTSTGILLLKGHQSAVYAVAFHPRDGNLLASGSGDPLARIWKLDGEDGFEQRVLEHGSVLSKPTADDTMVVVEGEAAPEKTNDTDKKDPFAVPTLSWSPDGELLATACLDGRIRLWTKDGETAGSFMEHKGAIFALKWSPSGNYLLSGGDDKSVNVWDVASRTLKHPFDLQKGQTLDVDWRPATDGVEADTFAASCGQSIAICHVLSGKMSLFQAHDKDINAVKWSPDGRTLATCSDDHKAKLWDFSAEFQEAPPCKELVGHSNSVYTLRWSPSSSSYADRPRRLVTASFDGTAKLWDVETGLVVHTLKEHAGPIFAIEFDFAGDMLITGSNDGLLNVWSADTGTLVKAIALVGGVFDLSWNVRGDKIAAALSSACVAVVDF
jgi:transducin (beta)-like 1